MTINQNSITAKFHKWFYRTDKLPDNLCGYFWTLVAAILLSPFRAVCIDKVPNKVIKAIAIFDAIVIGLALFYCHIHLILCLCGCYYYNSSLASIAAIFDLVIIGAVLTVIVMIYVIMFLKENLYCPKINWN